MNIKFILTSLVIFISTLLVLVYWFYPIQRFNPSENSNFSISNTSKVQFYPNLRFQSSDISFHIFDCSIQKTDQIKKAFEILENKTMLNFYSTENSEEISVYCSEEDKIQGGLFIAGEGGPVKITQAGNFNLISNSIVLLIRNSNCYNPNVAIHEILHALGFTHSENENNIMYNFTNCNQNLGDDIPEKIAQLYSEKSLPDLEFETASFSTQGDLLSLDFLVRNNGLKDSKNFNLKISADLKEIKIVPIEALEIGTGMGASLENLKIDKNFKELILEINYPSEEISKTNNILVLKNE